MPLMMSTDVGLISNEQKMPELKDESTASEKKLDLKKSANRFTDLDKLPEQIWLNIIHVGILEIPFLDNPSD